MFDYRLKQTKKFVNGHRIRDVKKPVLVCVLLTIAVIIYLFIYWLQLRTADEQHADYLVFLPAREENTQNIVQEIICPKGAELCFKVEDYQLGESNYQRRLMVETVDDVVLSLAELVPNPEESFSAQNSMKWPILKTRLLLPYARVVIGQMFATGCIQLDSNKRSDTLMIGLGGGSIASFLGEFEGNHVLSVELEPAIEFACLNNSIKPFPARYIAHKWFGLEKSDRQRVVVQDGIAFLNGWSPSASRFDCIILDACRSSMETIVNSSEKYPLLCPHPDFVNSEQIVEVLKSLLKAKGTLLINTFVIENEENSEKVAEERQFMLELFRHHFGHCYYATMDHNKILVCTMSLGKTEPMTNKLFEDRMNKLPSWLQNELDVEVNIVSRIWSKPNAI